MAELLTLSFRDQDSTMRVSQPRWSRRGADGLIVPCSADGAYGHIGEVIEGWRELATT